MKRLTRPRFARAFLDCFFRSRRIPQRVSSDNGQEVHNALATEMIAVLGIDRRVGLPYKPTFQAQAEHGHLESKSTLTCILSDLAGVRPTEWELYLPAVVYLQVITPYSGECPLTPRVLDIPTLQPRELQPHQ